jgi:hypothetical protein
MDLCDRQLRTDGETVGSGRFKRFRLILMFIGPLKVVQTLQMIGSVGW